MRAGRRVTPMQPGRIKQRSSGRAEMILFLLDLLNDEATDEGVHAGNGDRVTISLLFREVTIVSPLLEQNGGLTSNKPRHRLNAPSCSFQFFRVKCKFRIKK